MDPHSMKILMRCLRKPKRKMIYLQISSNNNISSSSNSSTNIQIKTKIIINHSNIININTEMTKSKTNKYMCQKSISLLLKPSELLSCPEIPFDDLLSRTHSSI
mmetsp:Transcript_20467/g.17832  ORF Transcript_20467/g.17832 Transcript_20467/m.17832 type:complete len:104 (-) Transcript_20467:609-920(-)